MIVAVRSKTSAHKKAEVEAAGRLVLIDSKGKIVAATDDWLLFAKQSGARLTRVGIGANYQDLCRNAGMSSSASRQALAGILQVLKDETPSFTMDYTCETPSGLRHFRM